MFSHTGSHVTCLYAMFDMGCISAKMTVPLISMDWHAPVTLILVVSYIIHFSVASYIVFFSHF